MWYFTLSFDAQRATQYNVRAWWHDRAKKDEFSHNNIQSKNYSLNVY